nr:GNAT family N-acetyltransferase [Kandeliimicrobium roseum]
MSPEALARLHAAAMESRGWSAAEFAALLAQRGVFVTGDSRCFALGRVVVDEAELLMLATDPAHRRQGLGRATLAAFHEEARARDAATAFLEVDEANRAARALYAAAGYAETGRRRGYYRHDGGPATDALTMALRLA